MVGNAYYTLFIFNPCRQINNNKIKTPLLRCFGAPSGIRRKRPAASVIAYLQSSVGAARFAPNLYIIGVSEKDRQEYMGHVSGSPMTNDVYTTFTPDVKAKNIYDIYGDFLPKF